MSGNLAECVGIIGASGTGKGLYASARLAPFIGKRLVLVWSPLEATDRYAAKLKALICRTIPQLVAGIKAGKLSLVFVPSDNAKRMAGEFDLFCRVAWHSPRAVVLVEELSRVTSPSWAPQPWQNLSTAGRHQGLAVIATAQRPAQIDKDFLGNCTEVRAYRVNYDADARAVASIMRASPELFLELSDRHYLHRWIRELRWERGIQGIPGGEAGRVLHAGTGGYSAPAAAPSAAEARRTVKRRRR